jgi:hypothetical protein
MRTNQSEGDHGITGPLMIIAVGTIFLVGQFLPEFDFGKMWPVLLIVAGVAGLFHRTRR